jgi:hypothetical protein
VLQLHPASDERVQLGAGIRQLQSPFAGPAQGEGSLECGVHGAAPTNGTEAVVDAGEKTLLERVGDVGAARKPLPAADAAEKLEHGLAEAVLEILGPQKAAVGAQQPGAAGTGNECNLLGGVEV